MIIDQLQFKRSESMFSKVFLEQKCLASFMAFELGVYMANVYEKRIVKNISNQQSSHGIYGSLCVEENIWIRYLKYL